MGWRERYEQFNRRVEDIKVEALAIQKSRERLEAAVGEERTKANIFEHQLEVNKQALAVLTKLSEDAVGDSLKFIEDNLNTILARIFVNSPRKIRLSEELARGKTPELHIELESNGVSRSLKTDSGQGIKQLISLLCTMCLICITGTRKFLVLDEVMNGLSHESRVAVNDLLWAFADIGFQFVIVEHGFRAKGSKVYVLKLDGMESRVVKEFIEPNGYYLDNMSDASEIAKEDTE